jgi:hypothetical protein
VRASTIIALSAAGATALLALSGCAGGSVPGTGGATVPSETPAAATTASEAPTTPVPSLAECLTGSWVLPEDQVVAFYSAASADLPELSFEPFGTLGLELRADGGYRYLPAFGFVLTLDLGFGQLTPRAEVSGDVTGTWSAEGDTLVLTDTNSSLSVAAELDGQPLDVAAATDALLEESPMLTPPGAVSCDDNTMTMPKDAGTGGIIEVQWARAG